MVRGLVVAAVCLAACSQSPERVRSRSSQLVALDGNGAFGTVPVTTTSDPHVFTVRPAPPVDSLQFDRIELIESTCPEFVVDAPNAVGAIVRRFCKAFDASTYGGADPKCIDFGEDSFTFNVRFKPVLELPSSDQCRIIVRLDGGASKSITVSGTGDAPPRRAQFSTTAPINFFTVTQGKTSVASKVIVSNTGSQTLSVNASIVNNDGVFLVNGSVVNGALGSQNLARNASRELAVQCRPDVDDPTGTAYKGTLTITTNDPVPARATVVIPIDCTGIQSNVDSQATATEHKTRVEEATEITILLENVSTAVGSFATFGEIELASSAAAGMEIMSAPTVGTSLQQGNTTQMKLRWTPPAVHVGDLGAVILRIEGEPDRLIGIGTGLAQLADVTSSVPNMEKLDFVKMCIGESKTRTLTMKPAGTDIMVFADYSVNAVASSAPFSADIVDAERVVKVFPPSEVAITVTAEPMDTPGVFESMLTVETDSPTEPTYGVPVAVEVLPKGATVDKTQLDFNTTIVTGFSETETATFRNCTDDEIDITGILLDGDSAPDFDILSIVTKNRDLTEIEQNPPFKLPRNGEIEVTVQMLPQSDGVKSAQLSIDFQEPGQPATSNQTVSLSGEAFIRLLPGNRDSYYRCSTGAPLQLAPLGLVLLFVFRRRRR